MKLKEFYCKSFKHDEFGLQVYFYPANLFKGKPSILYRVSVKNADLSYGKTGYNPLELLLAAVKEREMAKEVNKQLYKKLRKYEDGVFKAYYQLATLKDL